MLHQAVFHPAYHLDCGYHVQITDGHSPGKGVCGVKKVFLNLQSLSLPYVDSNACNDKQRGQCEHGVDHLVELSFRNELIVRGRHDEPNGKRLGADRSNRVQR